jgi:hypothetical protein
MIDRGPNQDMMHLGTDDEDDNGYEHASYVGGEKDDEEEVHDLGFIVDDHDDRRITLTGEWERLDELDTDEPLETNRSGELPEEAAQQARGVPRHWYATDYNEQNAEAEGQEEDFVRTSLLSEDPEMNDGDDDFTQQSLTDLHGAPGVTDIRGHVVGAAPGLGTSIAQDLGRHGFQIRDNPLMQPQGQPISNVDLGDEALGIRDVDEMGDEDELDMLADRGAREMENQE